MKPGGAGGILRARGCAFRSKATRRTRRKRRSMRVHDRGAADVVVIGAGLAGLACALDLCAAGRRVTLLEASDGPGGRMRTDRRDGFLLDRGFQVFNTAYPQVKRRIDLRDLRLRPFTPGIVAHTPAGPGRSASPIRPGGRVRQHPCCPVGSSGPATWPHWRRSPPGTHCCPRPSSNGVRTAPPRPRCPERGCRTRQWPTSCVRSCPGSSWRRAWRPPPASSTWCGGAWCGGRCVCPPTASARCPRSWPGTCPPVSCGWRRPSPRSPPRECS